VTPITRNIVENQNILPMRFITQRIEIFTMTSVENKTKFSYYGFITHLITIFIITTTYTLMHICFNQQIKGYDSYICNKEIQRLTPPPSK